MIYARDRPDDEIRITPEKIRAAIAIYRRWELNYVFGVFCSPSDYAIERLVRSLGRLILVSNIRDFAKNS